MHPTIQKFIGCYKQAFGKKRSENSEKDIMAFACKVFQQDVGKKFEIEHAWLC